MIDDSVYFLIEYFKVSSQLFSFTVCKIKQALHICLLLFFPLDKSASDTLSTSHDKLVGTGKKTLKFKKTFSKNYI